MKLTVLKRDQNGATMIEVLVSFFVLAIGLLGFAALMTNSLTMNQRAFTLSQAMSLANSLTERIRLNRNIADDYAINKNEDPPSSVTNCATTACTAQQIVEWDQKQWFDAVEAALPGGDAEVSVTPKGDLFDVEITVYYKMRLGKVGSGDADAIAQMENLLSKIDSYTLRTEL